MCPISMSASTQCSSCACVNHFIIINKLRTNEVWQVQQLNSYLRMAKYGQNM
jgi:hypothetical protein